MAVTRVYSLNGLCCPICADKIQKRIQKLDGVVEASIDFPTQKLTIKAGSVSLFGDLFKEAGKIARQHEPDIVISEIGMADRLDTASAARWKAGLRYTGLGLSAVIFAAGILFDFPHPFDLIIFLAAYVLAGGEVVLRALKNILKGSVFDENFLMTLATVCAFAIGEYPEGVAVMLFYQIGETFQRIAVGRSRKSITALMDIRPDFANLKDGGAVSKVPPEEVAVGAEIIVRPGEKIPLDGVVVDGRSALDTSSLTGESLPVDVQPGSEVLSGSINKSGLITVSVTKSFGESTVSKILNLIQNASSNKSKTENFITKFARYYTPCVVLAAAALAVLPPLIIEGASFSEWLSRALVFLVVSCPCALVISIPLSFFGGIGGASRNGVLVKGSNYLEALHQVDTVIFDKTGTLTKGTFAVTGIVPANGCSAEDLLRSAAHAESASTHPIAASIRAAYGKDIEHVDQAEEIAGHGVRVLFEGKTILAGNGKWMDDIEHPAVETPGTIVHVAVDGIYAGHLVVSDEMKPDSKRAVELLRGAGVDQVFMLTGDNRAVGDRIGAELGLDRVYAELLPHQKVEKLEEIERGKTSRGKIAFVGDGINDAPALARADIGIAMGGVGSDAAIEAADVVLMTDEPSKVAAAIRIAGKTRRIVLQNVTLALGVKAIILALGAAGLATMWGAVFGDVGVAVIAVLNAARAMRKQT